MPIKLPKTFARRKSSGNALDDVQQQSNNRDSVSSFRVLARPNSTGRSLDALSPTTAHYLGGNPQSQSKSSFDLDNEDLFTATRGDTANRGSGGTSNSLSTAPYDSAASSTRLSTTSTNPSSVENGSGRNIRAPAHYNSNHNLPQDIPVPPPHSAKPGFLKQAGRTFSFGLNRNQSRDLADQPPIPPIPSDRNRRDTVTNSRERAMTASSVTTAAPPRLDDSSLAMANDEDDFGNMFAGLGTKPSRENLTSMKPAPLKAASRAAPPQPIQVNNSASIEQSPYSWTSQNSRDGLMNNSPSPSRTVTQSSPQQPSNLRNMHMSSIPSEAPFEDNLFANIPLRHEPETITSGSSSPARAPPSSFPTTNSGVRSRAQSNATTKSARHDTAEPDVPLFDPALLANAQLVSKYEENQSSPMVQAQNNKVMTPAEFEKYKAHKDETRRYNKVFGKAASDDGSGDDYDDDEDDDREREAQAVKQRKKQEAHLAVYRQQMMKVTGDAPAAEPIRSGTSLAGYSLANTERRMSSMTLGTLPAMGPDRSPNLDAEEEDEDVPLGILAAHGFPNKNRPPQRLMSSSSNPSLRNLASMQGGGGGSGGSVVGEGSRGPLPAFARNLPADPYFGAGLVHQSERAPLHMHASQSQTHLAVQPQPSGAATQHPLHPAGLVGVIAGEERARALRRGSPNPAGGTFDMPMGAPRASPQIPGGYQHQPQMPYMPQMLSPAEQAQLQMSQSMTQMMQMQMQWMQQMQQMGMMGQMGPMGPMGSMPNMNLPTNVPGMPQMGQMQPGQLNPMVRPQSTPLQQYGSTGQRTMSTLTPSMAGWNHSAPVIPPLGQTSTYAHSIAPSERSNVGLASRYRPVSTMGQEPEGRFSKRASTFTSTTFRPWNNGENNHSTSKLATSTVRAVQNAADDEDDEQGWAEMQARREKKKSSWRLRRSTKDNALKELYNTPA